MKLYELTYLVNPDATEEEIKTISEKISALIAENNGKIDRNMDPIKRSLAYPIKLKKEAFIVGINFSAEENTISVLENLLKSEPKILREMISVKKIHRERPERRQKNKKLKIDAIVESEPTDNVSEAPTEETKKEKKVELKEIDKKIEEILSE